MSTKQPAETLHQHAARELSFILRNRAFWPEGFEWDYRGCETCAMGLAFRLGMATGGYTRAMAVYFNMSVEEADEIFINAESHFLVAMSEITPEHIADLLDAYADRAVQERIQGGRVMAKGDLRCIDGRLWRHDPQHDDPELQTDIGECPDCSGDGCGDEPGEAVSKVGRSDFWRRG